MTTYTFDLVCPRCNRVSQTTGTKEVPPPVLKCGDCLMYRVEVVEMKVVRCVVSALVLFALLAFTGGASAQQSRTVYGSDGRVQERIYTDSQGSSTIYGADGKVQGRTSTGSNGTTVIYDGSGNRAGTISPPSHTGGGRR